MTGNKSKEQSMKRPIEKHDTAAWANIETIKPVSSVTLPNEVNVKNAKVWVDTNEK